MSSLPGGSIPVVGASGSQGLLAPMGSWKVYVFPQGGHASQSSTGTLITFDSAAVASRFAASQWLQSGLNTSNIRQVSAVGGNSVAISGSALTIAENDRIYLIGNTQPTVTGGSATYTTPATTIRQRDDDGADLYTNSMITTDSNGLAQFWAEQNTFDCMIQDGNGSNVGSVIDFQVGNSQAAQSIFGATVTINAGMGVTGHATFGNTVTIHGALGVTGWAFFGSTVTMHAQLGVSSHATFGDTVTIHGRLGVTNPTTLSSTLLVGATTTVNGALGVTGWATFGQTVTIGGNFGVTGTAVFGSTVTFGSTIVVIGISSAGLVLGSSVSVLGHLTTGRIKLRKGTTHTSAAWALGASWGTATVNIGTGNRDACGVVGISVSSDATGGAYPQLTLTYVDGAWEHPPVVMLTTGNSKSAIPWAIQGSGTTQMVVQYNSAATPTTTPSGYVFNYLVVGTS